MMGFLPKLVSPDFFSSAPLMFRSENRSVGSQGFRLGPLCPSLSMLDQTSSARTCSGGNVIYYSFHA